MTESVSESAFLKAFKTPSTGVNGSGPILNSNANLLPTRSDQYHDISSHLDYRLGGGLGVARPYRRNDSQGGNTEDGFYGFSNPSKMFGRNSKTYDLNYKREEMMDRAQANFKKMGFRPNEVPQAADLMPWQWNDLQAMGIGGGPINNPNQYNRNHPLPDADAVGRRLYQPPPSRATKMLQTDIELAALRPNRTLLHPLKVVTEDRTRMALQRPSRNADVLEAVTYENIMPRGMSSSHTTPKVWSDASQLRQPVGTNDTGDRSCHGIWTNGYSYNSAPMIAATLQDQLIKHENDYKYVQGKDAAMEDHQLVASQKKMSLQKVEDIYHIGPIREEYPLELNW